MQIYFSPRPAPVAVRRLMYDAVEAMRIAERTANLMVAELPYARDGYEDIEFCKIFAERMRSTLRVHIALLQEHVGGVFPTVENSVFRTIAAIPRGKDRVPYALRALVALNLAGRSLDDALREAWGENLDSDLVDVLGAAHEAMMSQPLGAMVSILSNESDILDEILDGEGVMA